MPPLPHSLRSKCMPRELQKNPAHQRALSASLKFKDYPLREEECVCNNLIVKSFASCVSNDQAQTSGSLCTSTHSQPALHCLILGCVPKLHRSVLFSHTSARLEKDHLKRNEAARARIFWSLSATLHRHRHTSRQQPRLPIRREHTGDGELVTDTERVGGRGGRKGRFKAMNECGNAELVQESPARLTPWGVNALYRTETLTAPLICRARLCVCVCVRPGLDAAPTCSKTFFKWE